ncbi:MAG: PIN domain-containing protein [Nitrososphaerales archaeon]
MIRTVDTRFLIRHFTADTDDLKRRTREKIRELQSESAIVPTIVIHELYRHQYQLLGRETADVRFRLIVNSGFRVVDLDTGIARDAAELRCKYPRTPTADAIIAATAIRFKSFRVLTDDPHFQSIKEIKTEWV